MGDSITLRQYNGIDIPQRHDGYINATAMCQASGKQWSNFRQLKSTDEYLSALEPVLGIPRTEIVVTIQGGDAWGQGTWIHPRLASRLAQWISPEFAVVVDGWVLDIISGNHPMPNEVSHEGAIARGIAALMESQSSLHQSMVQLVSVTERTSVRVDELHERVERIETKGRRPFDARSERIFKAVVWRYYQGFCPVFRDVRIMDSPCVRTKERNHTVSHIDHWYANHKNAVYEGWLISAKAHKLFEQKTSNREKYQSTFREFQRHVEAYIEVTEGIQKALFSGFD